MGEVEARVAWGEQVEEKVVKLEVEGKAVEKEGRNEDVRTKNYIGLRWGGGEVEKQKGRKEWF